MDGLIYLLPVLGCAAMMGVMVWMMSTRHRQSADQSDPSPETAAEIARLRAEIASLREQQAATGEQPAGERR